MDAALALAARGLGRVWPNPAVGCVLVASGRVVGRGWTQPGGRPHGETEALRRAGDAAAGATAYVSLEPCNHWGKTPPCTEALIGAGVARVVVALEDPDPRVSGSGVARLRAAGIAVTTGLQAASAADLNAGFFLRIRQGRPLVALKAASSLDGRIATASGESRWITGEAARARGHMLRARYDAIMVGAETARADDPDLTCRLPGLEDRSPVRVVLDSRLRVAPTARLVRTAGQVPTWFVCRPDADAAAAAVLEAAGVRILRVDPGEDGRPDIGAALRALGAAGLTRLLVEGGGVLAASLMKADLVDRIHWFRAPLVIGGDGRAVIGGLGQRSLGASPRFRRTGVEHVGDDALETFARQG
ncbi:MAG: bifunctional diaminohydroxyphosphoribosylaminopyrimidine deaminase/5-amino-6-(5-phosphoribosylamino)uracil reductase RibD [Alphaproteobacteria bacterium]